MKKHSSKDAGGTGAVAKPSRTEAADTAAQGTAPAPNNDPAASKPRRTLRIPSSRYMP
ncbi:MAG: hypothetical protein NTX36_10210 [Proteobacteria bacterium]|nr:hypothetical protein [Pseudomonadota bacterium]